MNINFWFEKGCNYQQGVMLYASLKGYSPNLLRLFLRKQSILNADKLKYELGKFRKSSKTKTVNPTIEDNLQKLKFQTKVPNLNVDQKTANSKKGSFYRLNELHLDLHPLAIKQRNDFQTAISLHSQLTKLHPEEEGLALILCIKIEDLFDAIETAQKVLSHYVKHKTVLNIETRTFNKLSSAQLLRSRNNKSTSVCKYKKKLETLNLKLGQNLSKSEKTKTAIAIEKAENKLLQHTLELQQLNELINEDKS